LRQSDRLPPTPTIQKFVAGDITAIPVATTMPISVYSAQPPERCDGQTQNQNRRKPVHRRSGGPCKNNLYTIKPMMTAMDWLTITPLIVGAISKLSALALAALAERLLTTVLTGYVVGSIGFFGLTALAWPRLRHALGELHLPGHHPAH
jgi:hypothetical protein